MIRVILKEGKEKALLNFHPWVFSGAIDEVDDRFQAGDLVEVLSNNRVFLGIGYLNPRSQIAVRMLTFKKEIIDKNFFIKRFMDAKSLRESFLPVGTNSYRLVHSEGDFLPGLIIDTYADNLIVQFLTTGMQRLKPLILKALDEVISSKAIYERNDGDFHDIEGGSSEVVTLKGPNPPDFIEIEEYGNRFLVDIKGGQKTGFFLDQRENRNLIGQLAKGKKVLNCFAYTGGFSIYAARGGASFVTSVEIQEQACNAMESNFEINQLAKEQRRNVCENVFDFLRADSNFYDIVVLDPPAFCKKKDHIQKAARGYKDVNLFGMKRVLPGGFMLTSSCSSHVDQDLFQKIVFGAAKDAGREVQMVQKTAHAFDHPLNIYHPEGAYLKSLLLRVL